MLTPVEIEVLLACYYSAEPYNGLRDTPANAAAVDMWKRRGCIVYESVGAGKTFIMRTTEKGELIVAALRNVEGLMNASPWDLLVNAAVKEAIHAMQRFPQPNYVLLKVAEEAGEVVKAGVHFAEGRDSAQHVCDEMRQTIAMLYRLWKEGDQINGVPAIEGAL